MRRTVRLALVFALLAASASAQAWRSGSGRLYGRVTDEQGKPIEGAVVKLFLPEANGGTDLKTNAKGEWALGGIASGVWQIDFAKPGFEPRHITVNVSQMTRIPEIAIALKKVAADPNEVIAGEVAKAKALIDQKKYDEALQLYQKLQAQYPTANRLWLAVAQVYHAQGAYDREIDSLKQYLQKDPENVEIKLLTGAEMIARGDAAEGRQLLDSIDDSKVTEGAVFLNVGITLLNQGKPADALFFFDKTINRFPDYPDGYYYRGITALQIGTTTSASDKQAADKYYQAAKADLTKFVQMAPNAPEAATAKQMLDRLK